MLFTELTDKDNIFRKKYIKNLINRFVNASLALEEIAGELNNPEQALNIYYQTEALEMALKQPEDETTNPISSNNELIDLIQLISGDEFSGFRTTAAEVIGSNVKRSKAKNIRQDLYMMYDNYNHFIPYTDEVDEVFLKEAQLHIRLLHIHPFEDGNGRVARIILIRNLLHQNKVPCIITKEVKKEYCNYIENGDEIGLAKFFEKLSKKELQIMIELYSDLNKKELLKDNLMDVRQQLEYNRILKNEPEKIEAKPILRDLKNIIFIHRDGGIYSENISIGRQYCKQRLSGHKCFYDSKTGDYAIYCETNKLLIIYPKDDERLFMVRKSDNTKTGPELIFQIDDKVYFGSEFEYELNHPKKEPNETQKTYTIF